MTSVRRYSSGRRPYASRFRSWLLNGHRLEATSRLLYGEIHFNADSLKVYHDRLKVVGEAGV
jgi:hypothetical protein